MVCPLAIAVAPQCDARERTGFERFRVRKMSGWDEGNVYYTDQGQDAAARDAAAGITPGQAKRVFLDFLRNFRGPRARLPRRPAHVPRRAGPGPAPT